MLVGCTSIEVQAWACAAAKIQASLEAVPGAALPPQDQPYKSACNPELPWCLQLLDFWPAWKLWRSLHFAPHLMMTAIILTGQVIPPRRPKGSKSRPAAGGGVGGSGGSEGSHARQGKEAPASPSSLSPAAPVPESQRAKLA